MITAIAALLAATVVAIPATTPILCRTDERETIAIADVTFADLTKAFAQSLSMSATLSMTGTTSGTLRFYKGAEAITYEVTPYKGGLVLNSMHILLTSGDADLLGDEACLLTIDILARVN